MSSHLSSLVPDPRRRGLPPTGGMAEWLCNGLQSRGRRFDSGSRLQHFQRRSRSARVVKLLDTGDFETPLAQMPLVAAIAAAASLIASAAGLPGLYVGGALPALTSAS